MTPARIVLMGVAGSGKTTVGRVVASRLGAPFVDADDLHSAEAIAAMHSGRALDDIDRAPWLERVVDAVREALGNDDERPMVLACSALRYPYREVLRDGIPGLTFVCLDVDAATVTRRLADRADHFAGPDLLATQLATIELGDDVTRVAATGTPGDTADRVLQAVGIG